MSKIASKLISTSKKPSLFKRFLRNSAGSMTSVMGLSVIPIFFTAGAAIDYARVTREQAAFYGAVDAAALAIAADERSSMMGLTSTADIEARRKALEDYAKLFLAKDYKDASGGHSKITATLSITGEEVKLAASLDFPTTIMAITGITKFTLTSNATVKKAARPIEVTLIMDTTGSMAADMPQAKLSAKKLIQKLYGDKTLAAAPANEYVRISLVPFSAAVRLDTSPGADFNLSWIDTTGVNPISKLNFNELSGAPAVWNNFFAWSQLKSSTTANHAWNGCVEMRKRGATAATDFMLQDVAPDITKPDSLFPAFFNPDTPSIPTSFTKSTGGSESYVSTIANKTFYGSYIAEDSTVPNETTGLTDAEKRDTTEANGLIKRQENWRKYIGRNIGAETTTNYGPWLGCTKSTIVTMTYDRKKVEDGIDLMTANGPTNIPEGLAWGRRVISPGEPFTKVSGYGSDPTKNTSAATIAPYWAPKWQKVVVLMTDGENDLFAGGNPVDPIKSGTTRFTLNGTAYSSYGRGLEPSATNRLGITTGIASEHTTKMNADIKTICDQMKADGITIYTTTFRVTDPVVQGRVKDCATSPAHYKHSSNALELDTFFGHIGETMNKAIYVSK
jgi:Flp pilus assembly protein TadG